MEIFHITYKELEENPRLARKLLLGLWFQRLSQMHKEDLKDPEVEGMLKLFFEWIFSRSPLSRNRALEMLLEPGIDDIDQLLILTWAGKKGPPVTKRHAAIEALFRSEYLQKPWKEITVRVCPCGNRHTINRVLTQCRPTLQAEVRHLKRLLRTCKIELS